MTTAIGTEKPFHTVTIQKEIKRDQILNLVCCCFDGVACGGGDQSKVTSCPMV